MTVKLASFPAANVVGKANPVTLTPEPENVIPEIVTLPVPVLASWTVFVSSPPTEMVPNAIDAGEMLRIDVETVVVPVPLRATVVVGSRALLLIATVPLSAALEVGLKRTLMGVLWPALKAIGRCGPEAVNAVPVTEIPEIVKIPVPVLVSVTVCVLL
ncbi:MAG: hypothetical protein WB621_13450 [Candidatus Acidiferrales bacterium]